MTFMTDTRTTGHQIPSLGGKLSALAGNLRRRYTFRKMLDLDDRLLDDIGVTRAEVIMASYLPLSVNAAEELRRISLERRRRRM